MLRMYEAKRYAFIGTFGVADQRLAVICIYKI